MALMALGTSTMYLEIVFYVSYTWNRSKLLTIVSLFIEIRDLLKVVLFIMKNSLNYLKLNYKNCVVLATAFLSHCFFEIYSLVLIHRNLYILNCKIL